MISKSVLNTVLHHVGLNWIFSSTKKMKYDVKENNHPDYFNKSPRYNTDICYKLCGNVFDDFIRNDRIDIRNNMCYIPVRDKLQPLYVDDGGIGGGRAISKNATTSAL